MRVWIVCPVIVTAFVAGLLSARLVPDATAQSAAPVFAAQIIDVAAMTDEQIGPIIPLTDLRSRLLGATEYGTVAVQSGNVVKHYHADAHEIQYIVEGAGSFWLGDKEHQIKAGDLILIPKGTIHAGSRATTGRFKAIAFKMPPQRPNDTTRVD